MRLVSYTSGFDHNKQNYRIWGPGRRNPLQTEERQTHSQSEELQDLEVEAFIGQYFF